MLWCVSVAALGAPVVPEVNWMLIGSSNCSLAPSAASRARSSALASTSNSSKLRTPGIFASSRVITRRRLGSAADASEPAALVLSSGASSCSIAR